MSQFNNREYYVGRAQASRSLAAQARNSDVAAVHAEFATRYDRLADTLAGSSRGANGTVAA